MFLKIQKITKFIPIINMFSVFIWLYVCYKYSIPVTLFFKKLFKVFLFCAVLAFAEFGLGMFIHNSTIQIIWSNVFLYLYMFIYSSIAIKAQEDIIKRCNDD